MAAGEPFPQRFPLARGLIYFGLVAASLLLSGCVERRITVRSNPPGAQVYIDDNEIGTTPCTTSFIFYGTRRIRLVKDGFETLVIEKQPFPAPWYEFFPFDFVAENLWPEKIHDERILDYNLVPQQMAPTSQLLGRAEQLRRQTQPRPPVYSPPGGPAYPGNPAIPSGGYPSGLPGPPSLPSYPSSGSPTGAQWPSDAIR